jgi:hypothetical protein
MWIEGVVVAGCSRVGWRWWCCWESRRHLVVCTGELMVILREGEVGRFGLEGSFVL